MGALVFKLGRLLVTLPHYIHISPSAAPLELCKSPLSLEKPTETATVSHDTKRLSPPNGSLLVCNFLGENT